MLNKYLHKRTVYDPLTGALFEPFDESTKIVDFFGEDVWRHGCRNVEKAEKAKELCIRKEHEI